MKLKFNLDEKGERVGEPIRPKQATPGGSGRGPGRPKGTTSARSNAQLETQLTSLFETVAGGLYFVDPQMGEWTNAKSRQLAHAWAAWAKENAAVNRFLTTLVKGGTAGGAVGITVVWGMGMYLIALSRNGQIPEAWRTGAEFMNVPLHPPEDGGLGFRPSTGNENGPPSGGPSVSVGGSES